MTSIHISPAAAEPNPKQSAPDSPSSHSSFSDAYAEQDEDTKEQKDCAPLQGSDVSDDYAMTFDSDAEDQADNAGLSEATTVSQTLPVATVSKVSLESSSEAHEQQADQDLPPQQTQANPSPSHPSSSELPDTQISDEAVPTTKLEPPNPTPSTHEEANDGDIDIQQLLDNITANAEKNAPPPKASPPPPSNALPKIGAGLPTHASLPPRPNMPPMRHEDIQKYHAGVPGAPPAAAAFRAGLSNGQIGSHNAPGAPGLSADARNGLPPPPAGSFQNSNMSSGNMSPASFSSNRAPGVQASIESRDEADEGDAKWGPEVQKIYDQFIDNERMYVTEGLWDQFPVGSRLFIGMLSLGSLGRKF